MHLSLLKVSEKFPPLKQTGKIVGRSPVRILIITPGQPRTTGNWVSANRQRKGLQSLGHTVRIVETTETSGNLERITEDFVPDVVNLLHAFRSGTFWLASRYAKTIPMVVTLTGTDINHGVDNPAQKPIIQQIMTEAGAIITIRATTKETLSRDFPEHSSKLHHIAPAVDFGQRPFDLRRKCHIPRHVVLFLHPAGIRPVKGNLELLEMFEKVVREQHCRLLFCGPLLDKEYGQRFLNAVQKRTWADYAGQIPADAMPAAMRAADVILNNSISEGFANALQEAACLGIPILARDIPGNISAFEPGHGGLLYDSPEHFIRQAVLLAKHPEMRRRLSRPTSPAHTLMEEARQMERIYHSLISPL